MADQKALREKTSPPTGSALTALVRLLARQAARELIEHRSGEHQSGETTRIKQATK